MRDCVYYDDDTHLQMISQCHQNHRLSCASYVQNKYWRFLNIFIDFHIHIRAYATIKKLHSNNHEMPLMQQIVVCCGGG